MIADSSLFDLAVSFLPSCASTNLIQPRYGFPGESAPGSYPLVGGMYAFSSVYSGRKKRMHPGGVFGGNPQPLKQREISFDTSSKEPHLIRARVFVGNMNTNAITRDDIIRLFSGYGTLLGVTLFKGYAFIQYGNPSEADLAVSVLNGYNWNGSILDVKLAIAGMKSHNASAVTSANGVKRGAEGWPSGGANTKKERIDDYSAPSQNERNRNAASVDVTQNMNLYQSGKKERNWQCSMCQEACDDAAALIEHALDRHNIRLTKVIE
ncbi:unnamed protein product [Toxocara canis]|uniref:RRM domain-containing protein n=1 Tax=Toxocara canis TaxID=6265 RepID=A0A183UB33_TOXCA|nr:unnamed protein product [Toxocara canis]